MKRLWFAVIFLAISISICVFEQITVANAFDKYDSELVQMKIEAQNGNYEEVIKISQSLEKQWKKKYPIFTSMIEHTTLDDIGLSISSINEFAKSEQKEELLTSIFETKEMLTAQRRNQTPSFGTIF